MVREIASNTVAALERNPLALALVVINVLFLLGGMYVTREIAQAVDRKDRLLTAVAERCLAFKNE